MRLTADLRSVYRHMSIRRRRWLRCQRGCAYQDRPPRLTTVEAGSGVRQAPMTSARCTRPTLRAAGQHRPASHRRRRSRRTGL